MVCGMLGALPMTGVIVRSSANVQAGAKTRLSAILHGVWLLVFVVVLSGLLQMIPTASLAAVLVYTGYKLVNFKQIKKLREAGWGEVAIYLVTLDHDRRRRPADRRAGRHRPRRGEAAVHVLAIEGPASSATTSTARFHMNLAGAATFVRCRSWPPRWNKCRRTPSCTSN